MNWLKRLVRTTPSFLGCDTGQASRPVRQNGSRFGSSDLSGNSNFSIGSFSSRLILQVWFAFVKLVQNRWWVKSGVIKQVTPPKFYPITSSWFRSWMWSGLQRSVVVINRWGVRPVINGGGKSTGWWVNRPRCDPASRGSTESKRYGIVPRVRSFGWLGTIFQQF